MLIARFRYQGYDEEESFITVYAEDITTATKRIEATMSEEKIDFESIEFFFIKPVKVIRTVEYTIAE